jgi:hypothetical protein
MDAIKMRRTLHVAWRLVRFDVGDTWHGCNKYAMCAARWKAAIKMGYA